jgi:undecaprenyl pyrophosphate phosphatase UppP
MWVVLKAAVWAAMMDGARAGALAAVKVGAKDRMRVLVWASLLDEILVGARAAKTAGPWVSRSAATLVAAWVRTWAAAWGAAWVGAWVWG